MPITYTNRKGLTFHLCQGVTKTGKPRYYFAREPKGAPVEQIPAGFAISESVNGVVSLTKARPMLILPEEVAAVQATVQRHRKTGNYRVSVKHDQIEIYERVGPDADTILAIFKEDGRLDTGIRERVQNEMDRYGQFTPVLCLILTDAEARTFSAQRMCYRSSVDGWLDLHDTGTAAQLARRLIPTLGTDAFFELH